MAKTIWYSQPLAEIWEAYHKKNKKKTLTPKEFIYEWVLPEVSNPFMKDPTPGQTAILISEMFFLDTEKKLLHLFFMEKDLRDFLIELPVKDFNGLIQTVIDKGTEVVSGILSSRGDNISTGQKTSRLDFGIHIPYENKFKGYAFSFHFDEQNKLVFVWLVGNNAGFIPVEKYNDLIKDESEDSKLICRYFQLAVNTVIYMNTFPNCVVDGAPPIMKFDYAHRIELDEKISNIIENSKTRGVVAPHFRRAYFKRLSSDFYTHKKGQTILVSETTVNGKAKTVYTASDLEKIE
ncbi:hypothetical protein [Treponema sp.]|uniref:hypothetical protein n=1 Tax=Treponema sp. TaxID=166 RepID=UPI0025F56213|nr:hypothetical protein [Treponema sp.]MBR4322246.1 hypothetical protein [Treponema sp.]